ncbi:class I SAM-dependent methyltransferase [Micromonospora robiginosa]|uniref:Methyltransferase domain-containing protein n=1 Tax=Micromonospora robiginosa TaxID=2749844 RepID=A0A7L6BFE8_9ACTN|nr:methyltransferase domain-containing protein [Micromonospora ferruginea]QLQ40390.2 methyltransferase domain-containing protein [Micromonospora ferruginea]
MADIRNDQQEQAWNGYEGRHWATHRHRYDAVNGGFNEMLLAAVRPGDRVLDVGCGTGHLTRLAAARSGTGTALGIDLSAPMLAAARAAAAAEAVSNVDFLRADAQVHPFAPAGHDVVLSRFGVMFFGDPVAAFANLTRALRPGGRLAFVCLDDWRRGDLGAALAPLAALPDPPGDGAPSGGAPAGDDVPARGDAPTGGPLSLADPVVTRRVLTDAGLVDVDCARHEVAGTWGRDAADAGAFLAGWGPVRHRLAPLGPAVADRVRGELVAAMRPYTGPDGVRLRTAAWLVTARRPG